MFYSQQDLLVTQKLLLIIFFSNIISFRTISGKITATISDDLPWFLFAGNVLSNPSCNKSNILERHWSKSKKKSFILDYFDKNWSEKLQVNQQNANVSLESYLDNINSILDTCTNTN